MHPSVLNLTHRTHTDADANPADQLSGLVKSLDAAWQTVGCRAVDLSPAIDAQDAARIVPAAVYDPNRLVTEVGHGPGDRVTLIGA